MDNSTKTWNHHSGLCLDEKAEFSVIDCESCGFKHIVPIPTEAELKAIYQHDYYADEKPLYVEHVEEDLEWWSLVYRERYELFESLLPESRRRLIEIGSGPGYFLKYGQERCWQVRGIEASRQAVAYSRGLGVEVTEAYLTAENVATYGGYDVVHLYNVLEHLPAPQQMLQLAKRLLNPGGLISITVPNDYNPLQRALQEKGEFAPWWVVPPHHLNFFSPRSLALLVERAGFSVEHCETSFPIDLFLLMGENYIGDQATGRRCHGLRKTFELNMDKLGLNSIKKSMYESFKNLGLGRELTIVARRGDSFDDLV